MPHGVARLSAPALPRLPPQLSLRPMTSGSPSALPPPATSARNGRIHVSMHTLTPHRMGRKPVRDNATRMFFRSAEGQHLPRAGGRTHPADWERGLADERSPAVPTDAAGARDRPG